MMSMLGNFPSSVPVGLEDVSKYPNLFAELIARGYSDDDVVKIARGNIIRAFKAVETVSMCDNYVVSL